MNQYATIGEIAFWIALFGLAYWSLSRRRPAVAITATAALVVAIICGLGVYIGETGVRGAGLAIVTGGAVNARVATADTANSVLTLPPGSEVKVLSKRGDWIYAQLPNDLRGWLPAQSTETVRL